MSPQQPGLDLDKVDVTFGLVSDDQLGQEQVDMGREKTRKARKQRQNEIV